MTVADTARWLERHSLSPIQTAFDTHLMDGAGLLMLLEICRKDGVRAATDFIQTRLGVVPVGPALRLLHVLGGPVP